MRDGERQVAPTLDGIRRDHVARYEFAAKRLDGVRTVLDPACGIGYGAAMLCDAGFSVRANDIDREAIDYAKEHYARSGVAYTVSDASEGFVAERAHAAVCFEAIEHIEDPRPMLSKLRDSAALLIASVPNELVFPHRGRVLYHHRHYTPEQFENLLNECGWQVTEWHGQRGPESDVEPEIQGRTLIVVAERVGAGEAAKGGTWKRLPPAPKLPPESVAIVAMGASHKTYIGLCSASGDRRRLYDETWAINSMGGVIQHDLLFHMDDCRIQEARAERDPNGNVAGMLRWLKGHPRFITSRAYPDYPGAEEFPLEAVINGIGSAYFNSTVAYAVAYAMHIGVRKIALYGCDFTYPNAHKAEAGRGCVEFLLGMAAAKGVQVEVAQDTTLLDANVPESQRFYGYDADEVALERTDAGAKVIRTPREKPPTAEEMEQRYNHEPKYA